MFPFRKTQPLLDIFNEVHLHKVDFATGENPWNIAIDDFDLDGKPNLAAA
ncbi:MAG: hypothetical protein U5K54_19410 [Cytophagales bacterium]|nr:hypothetical protein [Cytophagales bacterium]